MCPSWSKGKKTRAKAVMGGASLGAFTKDPSSHLQHSPGIWRSHDHPVTDEEAEAQRGNVTAQSHTANMRKAKIGSKLFGIQIWGSFQRCHFV